MTANDPAFPFSEIGGLGMCRVCGGERVEIRGRYLHTPKRRVCPTCMMEMIESLFDYDSWGAGSKQANAELEKKI